MPNYWQKWPVLSYVMPTTSFAVTGFAVAVKERPVASTQLRVTVKIDRLFMTTSPADLSNAYQARLPS